MIDPRRLEVLRAFASQRTMTAAAHVLFTSTSAVSQQLKLLEHEVGVALLDRRGKRAYLTEAGATLARYAEEMAALSESAESSMRRFTEAYRGIVRVSAFPSFAAAILPGVVRELRSTHPELHVLVSDLEPFESMKALRDGAIDLAITDDLNPFDDSGLHFTRVGTDELVLCAPAAMDLPTGPIDMSALSDAAWLVDGSQEVFDDFLHRLGEVHGFEPRIVARCRNISVTLALVEAGLGVALLSRLHVRTEAFAVQVRSFAPAQTRTVRVARRRASHTSHLIAAVQSTLTVRADAYLREVVKQH